MGSFDERVSSSFPMSRPVHHFCTNICASGRRDHVLTHMSIVVLPLGISTLLASIPEKMDSPWAVAEFQLSGRVHIRRTHSVGGSYTGPPCAERCVGCLYLHAVTL